MDTGDLRKSIGACLNGDKESFRTVIQNFQKPIYFFCYHFLKNRQDAEDATVEIFLRVYKILHTFNPRYKFSAWLYKIAFNHLVETSRRKKRENRYLESEGLSGNETFIAETPDSIFFRDENIKEMKKALHCLSSKSRTVLVLRYYHQLTYGEISQIMHIPKNTVASLIFRGKKELRMKFLKKEI